MSHHYMINDKMTLRSELDNSIANDVSIDSKSGNNASSPNFGIDVAETLTLIGCGWYEEPIWKFSSQMTVLQSEAQSERVRQLRKRIRKIKEQIRYLKI